MKLIDPCLIEIDGIEREKIVSVSVEVLPYNLYRRCYIEVFPTASLPETISIKFANEEIFAGSLLHIQKDRTYLATYKESTLPRVKAFVVGEKSFRTYFDDLTVAIGNSFLNLAQAGWVLREIHPYYPEKVDYVLVSSDSQVTLTVYFEKILKPAVCNTERCCVLGITPNCRGEPNAKFCGWLAYRIVNQRRRNLGIKGSFIKEDIDVVCQPTLEAIGRVANVDIRIFADKNLLLFNDKQIDGSLFEVIKDFFGNLPIQVRNHQTAISIAFNIPLSPALKIPPSLIFEYEEEGSDLKGLKVFFPKFEKRTLTVGNVTFDSSLNALFSGYTITFRDSAVSSLYEKAEVEFTVAGDANYVEHLFDFQTKLLVSPRATFKTILLPTISPFSVLKINDNKYVVIGFRHEISKKGAFTVINAKKVE